MNGLEKPVSTDPSKDTRRGTRGPQKGAQTSSWVVVDRYYVVLVCPDGRTVRINYDQGTAYEVAASFSRTKVKASVVKEKFKFLKEVTP